MVALSACCPNSVIGMTGTGSSCLICGTSTLVMQRRSLQVIMMRISRGSCRIGRAATAGDV
ncbi:hypothetical protein BDW60DRAFT_190583 [Aspergillus nidulans var. acristatus]